MTVLARRGARVFMVQISRDSVRIADRSAMTLSAPLPLQGALAQGYWEDTRLPPIEQVLRGLKRQARP